jgi:tetratricopeptide (TPR) repeat protein
MPSHPTLGRGTILAFAALVLVTAPACRSRSRMPKTLPVTAEMRTEARRATEAERWDQAAQSWYSIFVASKQSDVEACANTARALHRLKEFEGALKVLEAGILQNPKVAELYELQGDSLVHQQFRRAAEKSYELAVGLDPNRGSAWRKLGGVRIDLGYEGAAIQPLTRAIELGEAEFETWMQLARAQKATGNPCASFQTYVAAFQRGTGEVANYVEAALLCMNSAVRRSNPDATGCARAWLERAIERDGKNAQAHFELGVLEEELGNKDAAIACYRKAIEHQKDFLPALRNLALLYAERKDHANVREMVDRALDLERDPERRKALQALLEPSTSALATPRGDSGKAP